MPCLRCASPRLTWRTPRFYYPLRGADERGERLLAAGTWAELKAAKTAQLSVRRSSADEHFSLEIMICLLSLSSCINRLWANQLILHELCARCSSVHTVENYGFRGVLVGAAFPQPPTTHGSQKPSATPPGLREELVFLLDSQTRYHDSARSFHRKYSRNLPLGCHL